MNATEMRSAVIAAAGGSVLKAAGVGVSAAYVDGLYSGIGRTYLGQFDPNARAIFLADWARALSKSDPKGSFYPSPRTTADGAVVQIYSQGYWSTQAYADEWDHIRAPSVESFSEAPLSVISVEHVQAGLVPLTDSERAEFDAKVSSGQVNELGQVTFDYQLEAGKQATSTAPSSPLPPPSPDPTMLPGVSGPIRPGPSLPNMASGPTVRPTSAVGGIEPVGELLLEGKQTLTIMDRLKTVPAMVWILLAATGIVVFATSRSR